MTIAATTGSWTVDAACRGLDPTIQDRYFFPGSSGREAPAEAYDYAKRRWCDHCPVREQCLTFALDTDQRHGLWGGHTPGERRRLVNGIRLDVMA